MQLLKRMLFLTLSGDAARLGVCPAGHDYRRREGRLGCGAPRCHGGGIKRGLDRESPVGSHRRHWPVPNRGSAPGHLCRDVHAHRIQYASSARASN